MQLLNLIDIITKNQENGGQTDLIYTDFEKAFDKVAHRRLLSKLGAYGINSKILEWIKSFLCGRKHQIRINGKYSDWMEVPSGIPQGSVLGPLLFIIFINDLPQACDNSSNLFLFADDAKMFKHILNNKDSQELNYCCQQIYDWSEKWLMKLNTDKCKVLTISRNKTTIDYKYGFNTSLGFVELERVQSMKDLGVIFDANLSFKDHIHEKINKAFQFIGIINRNFSDLDGDTFKMLYKSLVEVILNMQILSGIHI